MASTKEANFDIDPILDYIGPKGKWQYFHSLCMFLFAASAGLTVVSFAFPGFVPDYRCPVPFCETSNQTEYHSKMISTDKIVFPQTCKMLVPLEKEAIKTCYDFLTIIENNHANTRMETCHNNDLIFDRSVVTTSIVEDFGMTCQDAYQRDLINSIFMIGTIIGGFTIGIISDNSTVPTRVLPLTVSVIVRVRGKLVRLELEVSC